LPQYAVCNVKPSSTAQQRKGKAMNLQTAQHTSNETAAAIRAAHPDLPQRQTLYTVEQFAQAEPAFTAAALRNLIFKAEPRHSSKGEICGNGLLECGAIVRRGRKVMIHRERFMAWALK
jgi:hypothetical protein